MSPEEVKLDCRAWDGFWSDWLRQKLQMNMNGDFARWDALPAATRAQLLAIYVEGFDSVTAKKLGDGIGVKPLNEEPRRVRAGLGRRRRGVGLTRPNRGLRR